MQGFKPKEQRQPQDGNMGRDAVMSAIARQAGQAQQQPERPATESAPMLAMRQVFSGSIFDRRKAAEDQERRATGYANGGMVRGPGTGTSDDVKRTVPAGSYIMPADTTRKVGAKALSGMGQARGMPGFNQPDLGKPVPVALSNGEYQMPPEQVHAVGVETLNQIKDATHTPAARGFNPGQAPQRDESRLFLNQGGSPVDEERKRRDALVNQIPTGGNPPAPQAATPAPAPALSTQAQGDRAAIGGAWNTVKGVSEDAGRAVADVATMVPRGLVGAYDSAVVRPMRAAGLNAGYLSPHLVPDGVDPASMTPFTDQKRMREAAAPAPNAGAGAGRGSVNPPAVVPSAPAAQTSLAGDAYMPGADANARPMFDTPAAPASNQVMPGVYQHGRGQFSDNQAGMGFAPAQEAAGGLPAAVPMAERMAAIQRETQLHRDIGQLRQQATDANSGMPGGGRAFVLGSSPSSLFSRTPEQQMRDAEVQAGSIHKPTAARGQAALGRLSAEQMAAARDAAQIKRDQMRADSDMARDTMREQGATARNDADNAVRMADTQARGFDAQTARALDARRLGLEEQVKGIDIRAAKRLESLQTRYAEAKTDADRAKIAREIRDLSGKSDETADWAVQVTPQTKNPDGSTSEGSVIRYNKRTGEVQTVNGANRLTKDSPQVQQIVNDTSLTRDERKARLQALGFS